MFGSTSHRGHGNNGVSGPPLTPMRFLWPYGGRRVSICGSFTMWTQHVAMSPIEGSSIVFQAIFSLPPGYHQYSFFVDGQWRHDEHQPFVKGYYGAVNTIFIAWESHTIPVSLTPVPPSRLKREADDAFNPTEANRRISEHDLAISPHPISTFMSTDTGNELLPESQSPIPPFSSQEKVENVAVNEVQWAEPKKRVKWSQEEDLLISAWLNTPKDLTVDQNMGGFWIKVYKKYDASRRHFERKDHEKLKDHFSEINLAVPKFDDIYKQISDRHAGEWSESNVLFEAHNFYRRENGCRFSYEHAWRNLKDEPKWRKLKNEPKWRGETQRGSSKRKKVSESGTPTSSSNPETPTSCENEEISTPLVRPTEQKEAKKVSKAKVNGAYSEVVAEKIDKMNEIEEERVRLLAEMRQGQKELIRLKEIAIYHEILMKNTYDMTDQQRKDHEKFCKMIRGTMNL